MKEKIPRDTCQSCKDEFLGRCFHSSNYGKDVSVKNIICENYTDGRKPKQTS